MIQEETKEPVEDETVKSGDDISLKELIEKNIKWSQVIYEQNKKIKRRLGWMVFGGYFRLVLLLAPVIVAAIYLPPILEQFWKQYSSLFGGSSPANITGNQTLGGFLNQISSEQLQQLLRQIQQ